MARPRSSEAHDKVLRAALDLFGERGIDATSMDAIAQASGVSKATIYNHWADKEALLLEVMVLVNGLDREREDVDTGDVRRDLATVLTRKPPEEFETARNRMTPSLIAYSAVHPEFGKAWRVRVIEPPREALKSILRRGMERGLLRRDLDLDLATALLLGPMLYQHIFHLRFGEEKREIGEKVAEAFWTAHAVSGAALVKKAAIVASAGGRKDRRPGMEPGSLERMVAQLENDAALSEPEQLGRRLEALDLLELCGAALEPAKPHAFFADVALARRARAVRIELEQANADLYREVREQIRRGAAPETMRRRLLELGAGGAASGEGYDALDDLVAGVLEFKEPKHSGSPGPEMIAYQPTPARHIFSLLKLAELAEKDVLVDIGSGMGHVPMVASICTPAQCVGIEIAQSYVESAKQAAKNLNLRRVRFIAQDAREADLSKGTVLFLYTPFTGSILRDVLKKIRNEAQERALRVCTLGPCTPIVAAERWLEPTSAPDTDRVVMFRSVA